MEVGVQYGQGFVQGINGMLRDAAVAGGNLASQTAGATAGTAAGATTPAAAGGGTTVSFSGNVDQAFASLFMKLVREGKIQLVRSA